MTAAGQVEACAGAGSGRRARQLTGGRIRGDAADLWLRENDPAYASRDRDLRRGVKRLPAGLRAAGSPE